MSFLGKLREQDQTLAVRYNYILKPLVETLVVLNTLGIIKVKMQEEQMLQ
jgi:hypothetical protein